MKKGQYIVIVTHQCVVGNRVKFHIFNSIKFHFVLHYFDDDRIQLIPDRMQDFDKRRSMLSTYLSHIRQMFIPHTQQMGRIKNDEHIAMKC